MPLSSSCCSLQFVWLLFGQYSRSVSQAAGVSLTPRPGASSLLHVSTWKMQLRQTPFMASVPAIHPPGHGPLTLQVTFFECTKLAGVSSFCWNHTGDKKLTRACSANDRVETRQLVPLPLCPASPFASHLPRAQGHLSDTIQHAGSADMRLGTETSIPFLAGTAGIFKGFCLHGHVASSVNVGAGTRTLRHVISSLKPSYSLLDFF